MDAACLDVLVTQRVQVSLPSHQVTDVVGPALCIVFDVVVLNKGLIVQIYNFKPIVHLFRKSLPPEQNSRCWTVSESRRMTDALVIDKVKC